MTVEFYDLAQRLYAAKVGHPVLRVAGAMFRLHGDAVTVEARRDGDELIASLAVGGGAVSVVRGAGDIIAALADAGVSFEADPQLVVAGGVSLGVLVRAARTMHDSSDQAIAQAAAVVGWWAERADFPGTNAVIDVLAHARQRFITGAPPAAERQQEHWRKAFGAGAGVPGLMVWAQAVSGGELHPQFDALVDEDNYTLALAAKAFGAGSDWTLPDSPPVAAMGLRRRCNAAERWEAVLLADRLWRHRATHTGHVGGGPVVSASGARFTIACERTDSRLRPGGAIIGWHNGIDDFDRAWPFHAEVDSTEAADGVLYLTITGVRVDSRPAEGMWVSVMPAPPVPQRVKSSMWSYGRLQFGTDSWIASGKTPGLARRDVPLDVVIAAAESED